MWRQVAYGVVAAVAAVLAMAAIAAAAGQLVGADRYGETGALTAAAVVLAMGGAIDVSVLGTDAVPMPVQVHGYGELALRPLGVSLAGAVVLGAAFLLPSRRRAVPVAALTVRAGAALTGVVALAGLVAWLARGRLTVPVGVDQGTEELVFGFAPGLVRTMVGALGWGLVVLGAGWLGWSRAPVPGSWRRWRDQVRGPVAAAGAVAAGGLAVTVAVAAVAAAFVDDGPALLGAALLAAPAGLVALVTVGLGARWTVRWDGPLAERLDPRVAGLGEEPTLSLGRLAAESGGAGWLVPVAIAVVLLLACGAAAARTPVSGSLPRAAAVRAGRLGAVLVVAVPVWAALAAINLDAGVSVFGRDFPLVAAEVRTSWPLAAGLGLAGGTIAGFLGSLAVDLLRSAVRVRMLGTDG